MMPRQRAGLQRSIRRTAQLAAVGLGAGVLTGRAALRTYHQYRRETIYAAGSDRHRRQRNETLELAGRVMPGDTVDNADLNCRIRQGVAAQLSNE